MMGLIVLLISTVPEMDVSGGYISAISMDDIPRLTTLWLCNGIPGSCLCSKRDRTGESLTSIWQSKNSPDRQAHPGSHSEHDMDHPSQPQRLAQWLDHMSPPDPQRFQAAMAVHGVVDKSAYSQSVDLAEGLPYRRPTRGRELGPTTRQNI